MNRPRVLVTRRIPEEAIDLLRKECDVRVGPDDRPMTRPELLDAVRDLDGIFVVMHNHVNAELLDAAPRLRVVANYGVGVDHIDIPAATERGVWVTNTAGSLTETTAELGWALLLAATRRIAEGDRFIRAGHWKGTGPFFFLGTELPGKTLGVVGAGRIGQAVARRAPAFGMRAVYWSRSPKPEMGAPPRPLDALLRESDAVVLTVSLTAETHHLIGARELGLMKPTAYLVNISRGPVVDEAALVAALEAGRLAGAALDVYENEPEIHPGLLRSEKAVLVPHVGSATIETRIRMGLMAAGNLLDALAGKVPPQALNAPKPRRA